MPLLPALERREAAGNGLCGRAVSVADNARGREATGFRNGTFSTMGDDERLTVGMALQRSKKRWW